MFTCVLLACTPRAHGWEGYHEVTICLNFQRISPFGGLFIYFSALSTLDLLHFNWLWFLTLIFCWSNCLREISKSGNREGIWSLSFQNCFEGFTTKINTWIWMRIKRTPWPLLTPSKKKYSVGIKLTKSNPLDTTTHFSLLLSKTWLLIFLLSSFYFLISVFYDNLLKLKYIFICAFQFLSLSLSISFLYSFSCFVAHYCQ